MADDKTRRGSPDSKRAITMDARKAMLESAPPPHSEEGVPMSVSAESTSILSPISDSFFGGRKP